MARIRSKDMRPELVVRFLTYRLGYRYRLHSKELPGKPDIVRTRHKQVIFVHGCFWHQHPNPKCLDGRLPKSNRQYWVPKLERNASRDAIAIAALRKAGWKVLVVWECETKNEAKLERKLLRFLTK